MGTYVYAFNTNVRTISGVKVALAQYRYKLSFGIFDGGSNQTSYQKLCARRVSFFENHPDQYPDFFVMADKLEADLNVYLAKHGASFHDSVQFVRVGKLYKEGRSWKIRYNEGFDLAAALAEQAEFRKDLPNCRDDY